MKILQINSVANTGSTGRIAENIGLVLKEAGHESFMAYGRPSPESKLKAFQIGNQMDVYMHGIKTLLTDKHGFGSKRATKKFIRVVEELQPDAIGLHNLHGYYINVQVLFDYLKAKQLPVVWTFHDCWPFTGHCAYFDSVGCEKWKSQCYECPISKGYPRSLIDNSRNNFIRKKDLFIGLKNLNIVTPSHWLKTLVQQSFLKDYQTSVIHNGINLDVFRPTSPKRIERKVILGVASIWDKRKGLRDFHHLRNLLDDEFEIVLIGLSKKQIAELPEGILGIERTESQSELAIWYGTALCFVNPTYQDNFPTTNIEALACGTPVITYDTGGSPEAVDESTGMVVPRGSVEGLVRAIGKIESMDREQLRIRCRVRAERLFNKENRFTEYVELYEKVVNQTNLI